jgi:hypothetical protein
MRSLDPADRDAALQRMRRARTWVVLGAVGLTGAASAAAAASFRGHNATGTTATTAPPGTTTQAPRPAPSGPDAIPLPPSSSHDQGLQAPQQAPQPAPAQPDPQPPATSGGS